MKNRARKMEIRKTWWIIVDVQGENEKNRLEFRQRKTDYGGIEVQGDGEEMN